MHFPSLLQRRLASFTLAAAVMLLGAAEAQAQWKWRDSRGQIHLSDTPPPRDVPDKDVLQRPDLTQRKAAAPAAAPSPAASAPTTAAKPPVDPELEERRKRTEQEQAARTKADEQKVAALRKENCQRAREQLATMESGQRIARIKADGEREILDDEQRAREARRARDAIAADCR
jgi:Domain of unknown function (DUF4124)